MTSTPFHLGFERRIGYSFVGLLAGNAVSTAAVTVCHTLALIPVRVQWITSSSMHDRILQALGFAALFGIFSLIPWIFIGLPVVFSLKSNFIARLHWSLAALCGAVLGAVSLALLFMSLDGWHFTLARFKNPLALPMNFVFLTIAVIIAGVAFPTYCALVRRASRCEQRKSGAPSRAPQFFSIF